MLYLVTDTAKGNKKPTARTTGAHPGCQQIPNCHHQSQNTSKSAFDHNCICHQSRAAAVHMLCMCSPGNAQRSHSHSTTQLVLGCHCCCIYSSWTHQHQKCTSFSPDTDRLILAVHNPALILSASQLCGKVQTKLPSP